MTIELDIPTQIENNLKKCNLSEEQVKKVFSIFLEELMIDEHGHFFTNFDNWLNGLDDDEFEEIIK